MSIQALTLRFESEDPAKPAAPLHVTTTDELHGTTQTIVRGGEPTGRRIARVVGLVESADAPSRRAIPLHGIPAALADGQALDGWRVQAADAHGALFVLEQPISSIDVRAKSGVYA